MIRFDKLVMTALLCTSGVLGAEVAVKESKTGLLKEATYAAAAAAKKAEASVPGGAIKEAEIEMEKGKLIYSFDLVVKGKEGIQEVNIDAKTGELLGVHAEGVEDEAAEAKEEADEKAKKDSDDDGDEKDGEDLETQDDWKANLDADVCKGFASSGKGAYFNLEPGFEEILEGQEHGKATRVVITVTEKVKTIGGIEARIVTEVETAEGQLTESTRDYFAICKDSNSLLYLGEDVDSYENGKIKDHEGSWMHGLKAAKFGILMPGKPALGQKYYQEQAPGIGMDRAEIVSTSETFKSSAGEFKDCLKTTESSPLEPGHSESKVYAPGIGVVADGPLLLVKYGKKK